MVVDDSFSIRQMVKSILTAEGYNVIEAIEGKDAIRKANDQDVHMIITDVNMPCMDGFSMITEIRKIQKLKFVPIIVLTTESSEEKKQEGKNAGATGWIAKPFRQEQLVTVVKKFIG